MRLGPNLELRSAELWRCVKGGQGVGWGEQRAENFRKVGDLGSVSDIEKISQCAFRLACSPCDHGFVVERAWHLMIE